jgi:geranylgeranylglycerol-phosphate geranylgeranyltransferase
LGSIYVKSIGTAAETSTGIMGNMIWRKIRAAIQLMRPELSLSAGFCVVAGQFLVLGRLPDWKIVAAGFVCGFLLSAAALVFNDVFDLKIDRVNQPGRPLPAGAIRPVEAVIWGGLVSAVGLAAAGWISRAALDIALVFWIIGLIYNWRGKQAGLIGNLMVASSVAVTFILGAVSVWDPFNINALLFATMAFCIDLGEEIAGDAMDMEGDELGGSRSLALILGKRSALRIAVGSWVVVVVLSLIPLVGGCLGMGYSIFAVMTAGLILFFSYRLLRSNTPAEGRKAMRGVYLGVILLLAGFVLGQLFR